MGTKQDKSKSTSDQMQSTESSIARSAPTSDTADSAHIVLPAVVAEAIDAERVRLMQAHAVLMCLHQVLAHAEDDDAQYCADSAQMIARAIDDAVAQLDPTRLRRLAKTSKGSSEVRESPPTYNAGDGHALGSLRLFETPPEYHAIA